MTTLKILEITLLVIAAGIFLYIYRGFFLKFFSNRPQQTKQTTTVEVENINPANLIGKKKFKLISYKEALEESRQFIYNIAKLVMERFSPQSKENLLDLGMKLFNAGVQYIHVVDVFKISLERQRTKAVAVTKKTAKGRHQ
ncbi:MAG: DUF2660 domain-containing protein [Rickettsiales bacterium]|nr:DUF2660 domain-containing protein [Rickettsiales bacterium]